ncbi:MAG TPA: peptide chain release factor 1 [Candidatus Omnitrophica bacterium]|nr:peptide chain release factor 1 [Candidatus Omnitrophota bacterium]
MLKDEKKFEGLKKRYQELEQLLSDHAVVSDTVQTAKYAREMSEISPVVKKYDEFLDAQKQALELEHILSDKSHGREFLEMAEAEVGELNKKSARLTQELEELTRQPDPDLNRNCMVEIRGGTGGQEASLFAADLYRMYTKYAVSKGWIVELMDINPTDLGGIKEVVFSVRGRDAYKRLKYESGVHRVQRVPTTEASGRIHTSAATVAVLFEPEETELLIDQKDLKIDVYRSSGHGGQSVNTTDSAVRITHLPSGLVVTCQDERSQLKNKIKAMRVLRTRLLDNMISKKQIERSEKRKSLVGTGDRSEKIRTYNFPDRRVTDHRIGFTSHALEQILEGDLNELTDALIEAEGRS